MSERLLSRSRLAATIVAALLAVAAAGAAYAQEDLSVEQYLEIVRNDIRLERVELLTQALDMTEEQGAAFWPIFREYDTERAALGDRRFALIKDYAESYGSVTDEQASEFVAAWFKLHEDRTKLRKKYFKKVAAATSPIIAARFIQVENLSDMLIDIQVASEVPLLE